MGWLVLPKPGEKNRAGEEIGPCLGPCTHRDCAATRADAERPCSICREPIGYGVAYYGSGDTMRHAVCELKSAEAER